MIKEKAKGEVVCISVNLNNPEKYNSQASLSSAFTTCASTAELFNNNNIENAEKSSDNEHSSRILKFVPNGLHKYLGILLTLFASILFSSGVLMVKILGSPEYGFDSFSSSFWRYLGVTVPAIPLVVFIEIGNRKKGRESVFSSVWPFHVPEKYLAIIGLLSRGILGSTAVILRYFALQYLTIGDTAVITYATPVLVTVLAHFFLGEKCGVVPVICAITTFCGVVLITRPPFLTGAENFDTETLIGTGFACGSLLCASLIVIITRKIRNVHFSLMTLVFGVIGVLQATILTQSFQSEFKYPTEFDDSALILALAVSSFIAQMAIILALKFEQAGPVSLIRSCDVIFGFILQFIFLGVAPDALSAIGGLVVLFCVFITGLRKWVASMDENRIERRRLKFLLF